MTDFDDAVTEKQRADKAEAELALLFDESSARITAAIEQRDRLAECARELQHEYHALGSVRDHWCDPDTGKIGDAPVDISRCDDVLCRDTRAALDTIEEEM